jgi:hypothetical protein
MQTTLFQRLFTSHATPAQTATVRRAPAPIELKGSTLEHVAGGGSPNGGWTSSATTQSPNGGW